MKHSGAIAIFAVAAALAFAGCKEESRPEAVPPLADAGESSPAIQRLLAGQSAGREVITSATGLQYVDLLVGEGDLPKSGQICTTHAVLWLLDGTRIWSSLDPDSSGVVHPFEFRLGKGGTILGWDEGVAGMRPGGRRRLAVPPELAYGAAGEGPVPPNATLIFEVSLLKVGD